MTFSPRALSLPVHRGGLRCHKAIILAAERFSINGSRELPSGTIPFAVFGL